LQEGELTELRLDEDEEALRGGGVDVEVVVVDPSKALEETLLDILGAASSSSRSFSWKGG